jgi:hypothetical protein
MNCALDILECESRGMGRAVNECDCGQGLGHRLTALAVGLTP